MHTWLYIVQLDVVPYSANVVIADWQIVPATHTALYTLAVNSEVVLSAFKILTK